MKNLKKVLALVLVVATLMGFATVASAQYTDDSSVEYKEAVEVLSGLGVINGYTDGSFRPDGNVTRAQMAKMVTMLISGGEDVGALYTGANVFSDCTTHWAKGYIAYANTTGIVAGVGGGKFNPDGTVTGTQAAKMLLCALGYDASVEGYTGTGWSVNVLADARDAGLLNGIEDVNMAAPLSREASAQMMLNTLTATMVAYEGGTNITTGDGTSVVVDAKRYNVGNALETTANGYDKVNATPYTQFCEKYFSKLTKVAGSDDDFGRPSSHLWRYKSEDLYNASKTASIVFTAETSLDDVAKAIKGYTFNGTKVVDKNTQFGTTTTAIGELNFASATEAIAQAVKDETGNGILVEIFANDNNVVEDVVIVNYTVGEVTKVSTNKDGDVTYTINNGVGAKVDYADPDKNDTIVINGTVAQGDIVTYTTENGKVYVYPTTSFTGAQSSYNTSKSTITVGGETYTVGTGVSNGSRKIAVTDFGNSNKSDNTYYVDQYGYVVKTTAKAASTDYAYVVGTYGNLNTTVDGSTPYVEVRAVLYDGTVGVYEVALEEIKAGDNRITGSIQAGDWVVKGTSIEVYGAGNTNVSANAAALAITGVFGYTLSDNVMTLEPLGTTMADGSTTLVSYNTNAIDKNDTSVVSGSNTVLLDKNVTIVIYDSDAKTAKIVNGTANLGNTVLDSYKAVVKGSTSTVGTASIVFDTVAGGVVVESSNYAFIDASKYSTVLDGDTTKYAYTGYLADGTTIDLTATAKLTPNSANGAYGLYKYTSENTVSNSDLLLDQTTANTVSGKYGYGRLDVTGNLVTMSGSSTYYNMADATVVYVDSTLSEVDGNVGIFVLKTDNGTVTSDIETIYIFR